MDDEEREIKERDAWKQGLNVASSYDEYGDPTYEEEDEVFEEEEDEDFEEEEEEESYAEDESPVEDKVDRVEPVEKAKKAGKVVRAAYYTMRDSQVHEGGEKKEQEPGLTHRYDQSNENCDESTANRAIALTAEQEKELEADMRLMGIVDSKFLMNSMTGIMDIIGTGLETDAAYPRKTKKAEDPQKAKKNLMHGTTSGTITLSWAGIQKGREKKKDRGAAAKLKRKAARAHLQDIESHRRRYG